MQAARLQMHATYCETIIVPMMLQHARRIIFKRIEIGHKDTQQDKLQLINESHIECDGIMHTCLVCEGQLPVVASLQHKLISCLQEQPDKLLEITMH